MKLDLRLLPGNADAAFRPGEPIRGSVHVTFDMGVPESTAVWLKLAWRTAGADVERGTGFEVCLATGPQRAGAEWELPFEVPCPSGPFSVEGTLVSVRWELEARVEGAGAEAPVVALPVRVLSGPCDEPFLGSDTHSPLFPGFHLPHRRRALGLVLGLCAGLVLLCVPVLALSGGPREAAVGAAGVFLLSLAPAIIFGVPWWRRRFCRELSVGLVQGTEVETGAEVQLRVAFTPRWDGRLRDVSVAWRLEECARQDRRGEGTSRTSVLETVSPYAPRLEQPLPFRADERVSLSFPVTVPDEPTFHGRFNQRHWALLVRVRAEDGGAWEYLAPVTVRPPGRLSVPQPSASASGTGLKR
ncbi:MAG: hypothetical protein RL653_3479 [Pseudomonadota bacterium]|jgi:hypothetical protein